MRATTGGTAGASQAWAAQAVSTRRAVMTGSRSTRRPDWCLGEQAALAGSAGQRVLLGLAVQVSDPGLHDLVVNGGVHHGLR